MRSGEIVIASGSEAIQTKLPPQTLRLDCFALLAMTAENVQLERITRYCVGQSGTPPS